MIETYVYEVSVLCDICRKERVSVVCDRQHGADRTDAVRMAKRKKWIALNKDGRLFEHSDFHICPKCIKVAAQ